MEEIKQAMIDEAIKKHGKIKACGEKILEESFTQEGDILIFWFNDNWGSTRIVTKKLLGG